MNKNKIKDILDCEHPHYYEANSPKKVFFSSIRLEVKVLLKRINHVPLLSISYYMC